MARLVINPVYKKNKINKNIYGHFSEHLGRCIYDGIFVGENSNIPNNKGMRTDIVEALKNIKIPVLRWPGGCFADEYHWKDGIGPKENRKKMINTHWGGVVEDNSFGTHEFMELCKQLECEPYVNMNVGSGGIQEMGEWVEYLNFDGVSPMAKLREENGHKDAFHVKYIGVGNENWGCGGNMRPEYYADLYRRYQTYVNQYGEDKPYKIACGANVDDYDWTENVMKNAHQHMDAISLHYYTVPNVWEKKGSALDFDKETYYRTVNKSLYIDTLIHNHLSIMDKYDKDKRVGLIVDEWGTWFDVEEGTNPGFLYQQNTMRDAIVAACSLNIFNQHSDRIVMTNIAQLINVLQAVILTEGEKMLLTPTYHVFDLYKNHQDANLIESFAENEIIGTEKEQMPAISISSSVDDKNVIHTTLANINVEKGYDFVCDFPDGYKNIKARILTGEMNDCNTFSNTDKVKISTFNIDSTESGFKFTAPACSVIELEIS